MSYLILPNGIPGFQKAVISFWFRVPASTIVNVYNKYQEDLMVPKTTDPVTGQQTPAMPRMSGILPFMTFGQVFDGYIVNATRPGDDSFYTGTRWRWAPIMGVDQFILMSTQTFGYSSVGIVYMPGGANYQNPSFIGLDCTQANPDGTGATLRMRFQASTFGSPSNTSYVGGTAFQGDFSSLDFILGSGPPPYSDSAWDVNTGPVGGECVTKFVGPPGTPQIFTGGPGIDYSVMYMAGAGPDAFDIGGTNVSALVVTPDQWHHVLVSVDLSKSVSCQGTSVNLTTDCGVGLDVPTWLNQFPSISDPCQCWLAFDDVNYVNTPSFFTPGSWDPGPNGPVWNTLPGLGPNGIVPRSIANVVGMANSGSDVHATQPSDGYTIKSTITNPGIPTYAYAPTDLPTAGYPFGIPCVPSSVSHPFHNIIMAELQVFTGATLNTGVEGNRRKFISSKGRPVDPALTTLVTSPAIGDPTTWDPGADIELAPPSDPNTFIGKRGLGKPVISLTRTNQNWITPLNLGRAGSKITRTGKVKMFTPEPQLGK